MPHALVVDDDEHFAQPLAELLERDGFTTSVAHSLGAARVALRTQTPDVVLTDLFLPDGKGSELLADLDAARGTEVVVITGHASVDSAVDAIRKGAIDYLTKPLDLPRLRVVLGNVIRARGLREEVGALRAELRGLGRFGALIGASPAMQKVYDLISRVAPTDATVLVTGESGTGKDLVADTVHALSRRRDKPFLPVNCGAMSPSLIESELFGHERGSFTGADRTHRGLFERANGGTVFLDEIAEMPFELQVKLLRVLETGTVLRLGGSDAVPVDVRIVAATNRDPDAAVADRVLREDLLYRLKVFPIHMPPLRERGDDIELLADHFLALLNRAEHRTKQFVPDARRRLAEHHWPGNVRELKNLVQQAFILADKDVDVTCLPATIGGVPAPGGPMLHVAVGTALSEAERRLILATVSRCDGDKKQAAELLGVSLKTLYNRLKAYGSA
jgi:two-component system, NtrC family, response regulator AtoC